MKVALIATEVARGVPSRRISVTEKFEAPLLVVATSCSSGDTARPNGLGAPTETSTPAGVTKRPLGRIAAERPSTVVASIVGRSPAGARNSTKRESRACDGASRSAGVGGAMLACSGGVLLHALHRAAATLVTSHSTDVSDLLHC